MSDVIGAELVLHDALDGAIALALAALATHLTEVRDEFLATTVHDVQQPLTGIKASIQLTRRLLAAPTPEWHRVDHTLARAQAEVDRLAVLIRTLADASRISLGRLEFDLTPVDLAEVLEGVLARLDADSAARIRVATTGEGFVGDWDQLALDRVISNLLTNALKYSPPTEPVHISLTAQQEAVDLAIQDAGIGLEPDELEHLFERYGRSRGAAERNIQGVGLGLYLSRGIVAALGGRIWAESPGRDRGTTLKVHLPRGGCPVAAVEPERE
jgi:signal transduction histidine kinase